MMKKRTRRWRLLVVVAIAPGIYVIATLVLVASGMRDDIAPADVALVLGSKVELDGTDTTFASAKNSARIAQERNFKSVFVVSQYFHIPRSRLALERCHVSVVRAAHPHFFEWRDLYSSVRETAGYGRYLLRRYD